MNMVNNTFILNTQQINNRFFCKCGTRILSDDYTLNNRGEVSFKQGTMDFYCTQCGHLVGFIHHADEFNTLQLCKYYGMISDGKHFASNIQVMKED